MDISDSIRALLARARPGFAVRSVTELGAGLDHLAFEVNGSLVVRLGREDSPGGGDSLRREAELLAVVARHSPLPVPEPVLVDTAAGALAYPKLPGRPLLGHPVADPAPLAAALGALVDALHRIPAAEVEGLAPRETDTAEEWLTDAERDYREVRAHLADRDRSRIEDFLAQPPPPPAPDPVFCHNDLGAEHVLVDARTPAVTGVVDWSDAAVTDPAVDLARLLRDLGAGFCERMLEHYTGRFDDAAWERTVFYARCALLEDLAYGLRTGSDVRARTALAALDRVY